ncbi:MAG: hypothetical protein PVG60_01870 [Desulfarculaceae bacterium]|jgi:outer membrane protein assembly factor BamE (lipoprotein component of BamABCDE complex)
MKRLIITLVILTIMALAGCGSSEPKYSGPYVTLEQYDKIKKGDHYDRVVELCGKPLRELEELRHKREVCD